MKMMAFLKQLTVYELPDQSQFFYRVHLILVEYPCVDMVRFPIMVKEVFEIPRLTPCMYDLLWMDSDCCEVMVNDKPLPKWCLSYPFPIAALYNSDIKIIPEHGKSFKCVAGVLQIEPRARLKYAKRLHLHDAYQISKGQLKIAQKK